MVVPFNAKMPIIDVLQKIKPWQLGDQPVAVVSEATHLGLLINDSSGGIKDTVAIAANITKARRAAYALMGAGLRGRKGVSPKVALSIYNIYILPILAYGLEVLLPETKDLQPAISYHKKLLLQLCSLGDNVAAPTPYILSGILPLEATVHKKALGFLVAMVRRVDSLERQLIDRQLILKEDKSWVTRVSTLLCLYELPPLDTLLEALPSKGVWAGQVGKAVNRYWEQYA
jgi:hypothetical protein